LHSKHHQRTKDDHGNAKHALHSHLACAGAASTAAATRFDRRRRERTTRAVEPKRVLLARQERVWVADDGRVLVARGLDVDALKGEVGCGAVVEVEDDRLGRVSALDVVPAGCRDTGAIGPVRAQRAGEVDVLEVGNACRVAAGVRRAGSLVLVVVATKSTASTFLCEEPRKKREHTFG
jgi:hypothetical protein